MEQREEKSGLVLKYGKRRFDGGNEIELIRTIERQKALKQLQELQKDNLNEMQVDLTSRKAPQAAHEAQATQSALQPAAISVSISKNPILEAILLGPLAISIGVMGMLTATIAIIAFGQVKNEAMLNQSRLVLRDCSKTFRKGLLDTLLTPVRVYKVLRSQK